MPILIIARISRSASRLFITMKTADPLKRSDSTPTDQDKKIFQINIIFLNFFSAAVVYRLLL